MRRWFVFVTESVLVVSILAMSVSTGISVLTDSQYGLPSVSFYAIVVAIFPLWVMGYVRYWTSDVDSSLRTECCHSGATRIGPMVRCNVCESWEPRLYDSEANDSVVGASKRGDSE